MDTKNMEAYACLASAYETIKKEDQALKVFQNMLAKDPGNEKAQEGIDRLKLKLRNKR